MTAEVFSSWLLAELAKRKWNQADLARHSGLTKQAIANYVGGRLPNREAMVDIARGFRIPAEVVFRAAEGVGEQKDPWVENMSHKISLIPKSLRPVAGQMIEAQIDALIDSEESPQPSKNRPAKKASNA